MWGTSNLQFELPDGMIFKQKECRLVKWYVEKSLGIMCLLTSWQNHMGDLHKVTMETFWARFSQTTETSVELTHDTAQK